MNTNEESNSKKVKKSIESQISSNEQFLKQLIGDDSIFIYHIEDNSKRFEDTYKMCDVLSKQFSNLVKKKTEPNYFLCIKINNQKIIQACAGIQQEILKNNPLLEKSIVKIETLHITLLACYLQDKEEIDLFNSKLVDNKRLLFENLNNKFEITFKGLSTFRNQVVYVDLIKDDHFNKLIQMQKELVKIAQLINVPLFEKSFSPHMTLMKLSKAKSLIKKGIKKIDKQFYEHLNETEFGIEPVNQIHLCSMREKHPETGFYKIEWDVDINENEKLTIQK
ncbi:unnamed protein product [Brachionus calyciflorus]|uniref:A-kinase anchor protein 7-like phosphoesterase domain-containing protein n=1 Tax=Brachionus calyciflorus TaxID=104777 RepID=A0A814EQW6_9BILA|nr:unnamed protein product [Brachionus calyciflorus]